LADLDSKLVLDRLLNTPEFDTFVIEGKFSSSSQTVYYFEVGICWEAGSR